MNTRRSSFSYDLQSIEPSASEATTARPIAGRGLSPEPAPETAPGGAGSEYPAGVMLWLIVGALVCSIFLIALDMTIVAVAIPSLTDEFDGLEDISWYSAAFFMTTGGFQSTWGKIYKYFPLKISYLVSVAIFEIGSLVCALAPTSTAFIAGRAVQGLGAAGVSCGSYTIVAFISEPKRRPFLTGILSAVFGIASVLGPLLGGLLTLVTWRWCFYINLPIGVLPVVMITFFFHTPDVAKPISATWTHKLRQLDPIGTVLLIGSITSFLQAMHYGGQIYPWSSSTVIGLLVGSALICIVLVLWQWRQGETAIIIPRLITRRVVLISALYSLLLPGALHTMIYYLPIYFQAIRDDSPIASGVNNLPLIAAAMTGALGAGIFISSTGMFTAVMTVGGAIGTIGCGLSYMLGMSTSTAIWAVFQLIAGFGLGAGFQVPVIVGQVSVETVDISSTTSIILCFQVVGAALVVASAQAVFINTAMNAVAEGSSGVSPMQVVTTGAGQLRDVFSSDELPGVLAAYLNGIQAAFLLACTVAGIATLLGFLLPWKRLGTVQVKESGEDG